MRRSNRARLYVGAGSALPSQLVFVLMLFVLPLGVVPLVVAGGLAAGALVDVARGQAHPERVMTAVGDAWYAAAPAAVLALAGAPSARLDRWPVFVVAFAAQSALDLVASTAREWAGRGIRPGLQLRVMESVYAVDALLAPVGLLVAMVAERHSHSPDPALHERDVRFPAVLARLIGEQLEHEELAEHDRRLALTSQSVFALVAALEARDGYTEEHSRAVELALAVGERLGLDESELGDLEHAALRTTVRTRGEYSSPVTRWSASRPPDPARQWAM